jgi:hypothetical protein
MNQDSLFEQFANISKAHGYDILADQVSKLQYDLAVLKSKNAELTIMLENEKARVELYKKLFQDAKNSIADPDDLKDIF